MMTFALSMFLVVSNSTPNFGNEPPVPTAPIAPAAPSANDWVDWNAQMAAPRADAVPAKPEGPSMIHEIGRGMWHATKVAVPMVLMAPVNLVKWMVEGYREPSSHSHTRSAQPNRNCSSSSSVSIPGVQIHTSTKFCG